MDKKCPSDLFYEIEDYEMTKEYPLDFVKILGSLVKDYIYYAYNFCAFREGLSISTTLCKGNFIENEKEYYRLKNLYDIRDYDNFWSSATIRKWIYQPKEAISLSNFMDDAHSYDIIDLAGKIAELCVYIKYIKLHGKEFEDDLFLFYVFEVDKLNEKIVKLIQANCSKSDRKDMIEFIEAWRK